ncbi:MAG TPA: DOPA 4,5-dioxygenase family protein [Stellaceae bacterium]|jgi:DOPA 4,5-dioxygenase|nr:DOPA 4,5-dioxygenase family protein [Stellaceae bacterium]
MSEGPQIYGYHAHVYYDADTLPAAERLHQGLSANFPIEMGQFSGAEVGPHPVPQFQIIFTVAQFQDVVPWLMVHREGLDILVHPLTDDMVDDHSVYALWLGAPIALKLHTMQRRGYRDALLPKAA